MVVLLTEQLKVITVIVSPKWCFVVTIGLHSYEERVKHHRDRSG